MIRNWKKLLLRFFTPINGQIFISRGFCSLLNILYSRGTWGLLSRIDGISSHIFHVQKWLHGFGILFITISIIRLISQTFSVIPGKPICVKVFVNEVDQSSNGGCYAEITECLADTTGISYYCAANEAARAFSETVMHAAGQPIKGSK